MRLPRPRGPLSGYLIEELVRPPHELASPPPADGDVLTDHDFQLALYVCYELHYRGFEGVDDRWEWQPSLITFRSELERLFEEALRAHVPALSIPAERIPDTLEELARPSPGPSLPRYFETSANQDHAREFLMHRSIYHLREADSHTWAIPRLTGRPKAALVEIQMDEYGSGIEERMHSSLFRESLEALGLDTTYGVYIDDVPGVTLATVNLMSFFGLHRRWRAACVGHLALFEMTSSDPNRRYGRGMRRLGYGDQAAAFFDEHVEADSIHEVIAANDLAGALAAEEQSLADDVLFGARALDLLDTRFAQHVLDCWERGRSSLLDRQASAAQS